MKNILTAIWVGFVNMPEQIYNKIYKLVLILLFTAFIVQLSGIKTELKRIAFAFGKGDIFAMDIVENSMQRARKELIKEKIISLRKAGFSNKEINNYFKKEGIL